MQLPATKFYRVTVTRPTRKRDGTLTVKKTARAQKFCRGAEEVVAFVEFALITNPGPLNRLVVEPVSEREYTRHTHKAY